MKLNTGEFSGRMNRGNAHYSV